MKTKKTLTANGKRAKHTRDAERKQIPAMTLRNFVRELYCINCKIKCTKGAEQQFWKREKQRLWLSLVPFRRRGR